MALRRLAPVIMEAAEAASRRLGWSGSGELSSLSALSVSAQQRKEG
jgi:hypothetical protein